MTPGALHATVFLFLFSLVLAGANLAFTAHEINAVRRAEASVTQLCQAGNEARAQQVGLWTYIIHISKPPPHESAAQRRQRLATVKAFDAHLHQIFAPRDCQAISR